MDAQFYLTRHSISQSLRASVVHAIVVTYVVTMKCRSWPSAARGRHMPTHEGGRLFKQRRPWIDAGWASSENPEIPDFPDTRRALQDQVCNVMYSGRSARHIRWYIFDELRWDVGDKFVRRILEASVFVADSVIHDCPELGGRSSRAGCYQRAT
jgi:hypothetical protein